MCVRALSQIGNAFAGSGNDRRNAAGLLSRRMKTLLPSCIRHLPAKVSPSLIAALAPVFLATDFAIAAPLATDGFATTTDGSGGTYSTATANSRIYGQNPTASNVGFTGAWGNLNALTTQNLRVETSGLTHALLQGTAAAGDIYGMRNTLGRTVTRDLSSTVETAISGQEAASGEIWFSSLTSATGVSFGNVTLGLGANLNHDATATGGIQIAMGTGQIAIYNGATQLGSGFTFTAGLTYLVAVKIDFTAGGTSNDSVTVEIYAPTATVGNPTATITASGLTISSGDLGYLVFHQDNTFAYANDAATPRFDEFRLGLTQGDVMAIPEPTVAGFLSLGLLATFAKRRRRNL